MKILKRKKPLTILGGSTAAFVVVAGLSIGLGVGLTRGDSSKDLTLINEAKQISLGFKIQDVNSSLTNVLAVDLTGISQNNFANFQYLVSSDPTSLTLNNSDDESANFNFVTGESNSLYNGFGSQGTQRFYVPIAEGNNASYLILQQASSDDTTTNYLYVEGVGVFTDGTNVFDQSFSGTGLTNPSNLSANLTFEIGTPVSVPVPATESLQLSTQNVNSQLNNVLAIDTTNLDTTNFASLAYVEDSDPNPVPLTKDGGSATFNVTTGSENNDNVLLNGFSQNGHLYLPITTSDGSNATYLELEDATSDDSNSTYLYVDELGYFSNTNSFTPTFKATNLNESPTLDLILSTNGSSKAVPVPTTPDTKPINFTTTNLGSNFTSVLNAPLDTGEDASTFKFLSSVSPSSITFNSFDTNNSDIDIKILTGLNNEILFRTSYLVIPIEPVSISSSIFNYLTISINVVGGDSFLIIRGVTQNTTGVLNQFFNLNNSPTATLNFSIGN